MRERSGVWLGSCKKKKKHSCEAFLHESCCPFLGWYGELGVDDLAETLLSDSVVCMFSIL